MSLPLFVPFCENGPYMSISIIIIYASLLLYSRAFPIIVESAWAFGMLDKKCWPNHKNVAEYWISAAIFKPFYNFIHPNSK